MLKKSRDWNESEIYTRRVADLMHSPALAVGPDASIQELALFMSQEKISSVLIADETRKLLGIVTEEDLVRRVLVAGIDHRQPVSQIMTREPVSIRESAYLYEAQLAFYLNAVKHLPVLDEAGLLAGIITLSDLFVRRNHDNFSALQNIESMSYEDLQGVKGIIYEVLASLIKDEIPALELLEVLTSFYDRLVQRAFALAVEALADQGFGRPPLDFAWYLMGSGGRGEQFMMTDQDHFLVYDDLSASLDLDQATDSFDGQAEDIEEAEAYLVEEYFTLLGKKIVEVLEAVGYKPCPGLMMASEHQWRGNLSRWQERFRRWALKGQDQDILNGHNFLSFRFLAGSEDLDEKFTGMVAGMLEKSSTFLYLMAQEERDFLVPDLTRESKGLFGGRKGKIDIKLHALFPLHRCIQILGVHNQIVEGQPLEILAELVQRGQMDEDLAREVIWAYDQALAIRIKRTWYQLENGLETTSQIELKSLSDWEYENLVQLLALVRRLQNFLINKL